MSDISPSSISTDAEFEKQVAECTSSEQIKVLMASRALALGLVQTDNYDENVLHPVDRPTPQKVGRVITLNGVKHSLIADDEAGLAAQEAAIYRAALSQPPAAVQPRDASTGQFTSAEDAAARAGLELQFKRGDIDAQTYLEKSGAIAQYLEKNGVPLDELKAQVEEKQNERFAQSWESATQAFIARHPEWPGGDANRDMLGKIIQDSNLVDTNPLEALETAYQHASANGLLVANEEVEVHKRILEAKTPSELAAALRVPERQKAITEIQQNSGLFGR